MTDVTSSSSKPAKGNGISHAPEGSEPTRVAHELSGLRRELLEARNLVIKTDNLLKTFHIELKSISTKQQQFERRHFVGHIAAYAVIGLLAAGGAILVARVAGEASRQEAEHELVEARQARAAAEAADKEASGILAARDTVATEAQAAYQLLSSDAREEQERGLERLAGLDAAKLDSFSRSVLERESGELRRRLASEAYGAGMADYRRGKLREAAEALERYLRYAQPLPAAWQPEERGLAAYYLGATYNQIGQHGAAIEKLEGYLASAPAGDLAAYGYLLLGDSLQASGRKEEARRAFERGLRAGAAGRTERALRDRLDALSGT